MHVVVFFTFGVSLKLWKDTGLIERELLLYKKFIEDGHQITLLTYGDKEDYECYPKIGTIKLLPVYSFFKRPENRILRLLQSLLIPFHFRKLFLSADVFKTNQMKGAWVPALAKLLYRKKLMVRCGYELFRNLVREKFHSIMDVFTVVFVYLLEFVVYRYADKIIISSLSNRDFVCRIFRIKADKVTLLRNFVDVDLFRPKETVKYDNAILYIGRLLKCKNVLALLKALKNTPYRLDIVGEGEQKETMKRYALQNKIDIRFLGIIQNDELPVLINRYHLYILPSFYENNPKTLLEVMSCSGAVIGTDVEGTRELIVDGHTGLLCQTDPVSIRKAINKLLDNKKLRIDLGKNAREFILKNCSLDQMYQKELSLYNHLLFV